MCWTGRRKERETYLNRVDGDDNSLLVLFLWQTEAQSLLLLFFDCGQNEKNSSINDKKIGIHAVFCERGQDSLGWQAVPVVGLLLPSGCKRYVFYALDKCINHAQKSLDRGWDTEVNADKVWKSPPIDDGNLKWKTAFVLGGPRPLNGNGAGVRAHPAPMRSIRAMMDESRSGCIESGAFGVSFL